MPASDVTMDQTVPEQPRDRRSSQRLDIRLPVEVVPLGGESASIRTSTRNVSAGGLYFEGPAGVLEPGKQIHFSLSVPPGAGYFPYSGRGTGVAEIVRIDVMAPDAVGHARVGVAARFSQPLKFVF